MNTYGHGRLRPLQQSILSALLVLGFLLSWSCAGTGRSASLAADGPTVGLRTEMENPAPGPRPNPPGIDVEDGERAPLETTIGRDEAVAARLATEGQVARHRFEARAGELALFELVSWGYARGWRSTAALVIRQGGQTLARQERPGGTLYQLFLPFVAPADGTYVLDVEAVERSFRYVLVRHSNYVPREPGDVFDTADSPWVHGWLAGPDDWQTYSVSAPAGSIVALRVEPTGDRGLRQKRAFRERFPTVALGMSDPERASASQDPRRQDDGSIPDFVLDVEGGENLAGEGFSVLQRVPENGELRANVRQTSRGPGGLFDLFIERDVALEAVEVYVGDHDDDPVKGAHVAVLREPALEPFGSVTTGPDGTATLLLPRAPFTVVMRGPDGSIRTERTNLVEARELNLVLTGGR